MNMALNRRKSLKANDIIHDQFIILGKLDNLKHSSKLYKGFDKHSKDFVVLKITSAAYKEKNKYVTKILQKLKAEAGVPKIIWRGEIAADTITVTECLGPNLKKLFLLMDKQFTIPTIAQIAIQVLNTLQAIHKHDYVCCNIMPKEILISLKKKVQTMFITDYKQARKVKNNRIQQTDNINHAANKAIINKFSSVNLHLGLSPSKKDDLESLGYILVYFFKNGELFDKKVKVSTRDEKMKYYEQQKLTLIPEVFCNGLPQEMISYMTHIKSLQTNQLGDKIEYEHLKKLFKTLYARYNTNDTNFQYDWMSKARTMYKGKKNLDLISQEPSKSELISIQSPDRGSDLYLTDFADTKEQKNSALKKLFHSQSDDYDRVGMDEFDLDSDSDQPIFMKFKNLGVFNEKIKTIEQIKSRSLQHIVVNQSSSLGGVQSDQGSHQSNTNDWTVETNGGKVHSVTTPKSEKMSSFGKGHLRQKSLKAK